MHLTLSAFRLSFLVIQIVCYLVFHQTYAQCLKPTFAQAISNTAYCPGTGEIKVTNVMPALTSPDTYLYALYTSSGSELRTWQTSSTFKGIDAGNYTVRIRADCQGGVGDYYPAPVTVYVSSNPFKFFNAFSSPALNCCNGMISARSFLNSGNAIAYSLVTSQDAMDLPSNYVRPRQSSGEFTMLCSGTYYIRVYDSCNQSQTIIRTVTDGIWSSQLDSVRVAKINCSDINVHVKLKNIPLASNFNVVEKSWIQWPDNSLDTIQLKVISASNGPFLDFNIPATKLYPSPGGSENFPTSSQWPIPIKIFYKDNCGITTEFVKNLDNPGALQVQLKPSNLNSCDSITYTPTFSYGPPGIDTSIPYIGSLISFSLDNGINWNTLSFQNNAFQLKLKREETYAIQFKVCGDIVGANLNTPALEPLNPIATVTNSTGCFGNLIVGNQGSIKNIYVKLLNGPVAPLPDATYRSGQRMEFRNLPIGTYAYEIKDTISAECPREAQGTVTISQIPLKILMEAQTKTSCHGKISLGFANADGTSIADGRAVQVEVLQQPAGADIPTVFSIPDVYAAKVYPQELLAVAPGEYSFRLTDSTETDCHRQTIAGITVPEEALLNLDFDYQKECNGNVTFTAKGTDNTITTSGELITRAIGYAPWSIQLLDSLGRSGFIAISSIVNVANKTTVMTLHNVSPNKYSIHSSMSPYACHLGKTDFLGQKALTMDSPRILEGCESSPGAQTIVTQGSGGTPGYTYSLYQNSISEANLVVGPQTSGMFSNVPSAAAFIVVATDQCGTSTQRTASQSESNYYLTTSAQRYCPGDAMTLSMTPVTGATYVWKKNDVIIPLQSSSHLHIPNVQPLTDDGIYSAEMILNDCSIPSNNLKININCAALPVVLSEFNANIVEEKVLLTWKTTSESRFSGFTIERSLNGKHWESIGFAPSKSIDSESRSTQSYYFSDLEILAETQYYRLKNLDLDGTYAYSQIRSVNLKGLERQIEVYPNPASQRVTLSNIHPESAISLLDVTGKIVYKASAQHVNDGKLSLDVSQINSGTYLLFIKDKMGNTITKKIAVTH